LSHPQSENSGSPGGISNFEEEIPSVREEPENFKEVTQFM